MEQKTVLSVLDFGAKADGSLQTEHLQQAVDDCFLRGGGEVQIPAGTFLTGGIRLRSGVTLHLLSGAVLKGSRDPEDYFAWKNDALEPFPFKDVNDCIWAAAGINAERDLRFMRADSRWNNALIRAQNAENVAVIGEEGSVIDGSNCYDALGEESYRGPHGMTFSDCRNITLRGYTVQHTGNWAHNVRNSQNIIMDHVTTLAGHDGIHMSTCDNVVIADSVFYTGDDSIAGFDNLNITVTRCEINTACSAVRFGGTNALIEDCHMFGPARYLFRGSLTPEEKKTDCLQPRGKHRYNMLSVFTYYADFSLPIRYQPGQILFRRCKIENADRLIHYNYSGNERWQINRPLRSVCFEDVTATGISMPLTLYGDRDIPISATFERVSVSMRAGSEKIALMHLCHYDSIVLRDVSVCGLTDGPLFLLWSEDGRIEWNGLDCTVPEEHYRAVADVPFVCHPI